MSRLSLYRWFRRLLGADTLLIAFLLILQALRLSPHYTAENVGQALSEIALPLGLWAVLGIMGLCLRQPASPLRASRLKDTAGVVPPRRYRLLQISLMVVSVVLIVLGIANQGLRDMLYKAIQICTECIGLG